MLHKYREKRKFTSTPEPAGKLRKGIKQTLHFVVHKHNASRLHYDFRLELDGVLKSWAVPKGPSMNPNDKRLAMMVEDHPFEYRKFEGTIPKGNYGGGEVIIWDEGIFSSIETTDPNESENMLRAGLAKGHLQFLMRGQKLLGIFDLVKLPKNDQNKNDNGWLLIKRPDSYATLENILLKDQSVISGRTVEKAQTATPPTIITVITEGKRQSMLHQIRPMLAKAIDQPFDRLGWIFEIKWDGYRAISVIDNQNVSIYSRNHQSFNDNYAPIVTDLKKISSPAVLDGEIVVLDQDGTSNFQNLQDYSDNFSGELWYYVFDILYYDGYDLRNLPLVKRKQILEKALPPLEHVKISDHVENYGISFFSAAISAGAEGIIAKDGNSPYLEDVRSSQWLKIKNHLRQEAIIGGYTEPRGGRGYLGALVLGLNSPSGLRYIGHTGGGLTDQEIKRIYSRLHSIEINESPFSEQFETNAPVHWVKPEIVCEVKFSNWTRDHHLRQPIFLGFRKDKNPTEVTVEQTGQAEAVFKTGIKEKKKIRIDGRDIVITNGSKKYWSKENISKNDLVEYYQTISKYILPFLKDRPESLLRHPNGIEGASFFQKNFTDFPDWVKIFPFKSDSEKRIINYIVCNDRPSLIYMVNLGCIEINPWSSRIQNTDYPDYLVIDLDPDNIAFSEVVKTALEIKDLLDKLAIPAFIKTSGKRGLHIYAPTKANYTYDQIRTLCELLMRIIHDKLPKTTSLVRDPRSRLGRVYLDYLQNRIGQTMSAPYCVRPISGALVSTPLNWSEVNESLNPTIYNMSTVIERIKNIPNPWQNFFNTRGFDLKHVFQKISNVDRL